MNGIVERDHLLVLAALLSGDPDMRATSPNCPVAETPKCPD